MAVNVQRIIDENKWFLYIFFSFLRTTCEVISTADKTMNSGIHFSKKELSLRLFETEGTVIVLQVRHKNYFSYYHYISF